MMTGRNLTKERTDPNLKFKIDKIYERSFPIVFRRIFSRVSDG